MTTKKKKKKGAAPLPSAAPVAAVDAFTPDDDEVIAAVDGNDDPAGVPGTPGEYDGNGTPNAAGDGDALPSMGGDALVPSPERVERLLSLDADVPAEGTADESGGASPSKPKKGSNRYDTPEKRAERNRKEREKRARAKRQEDTRRATGIAAMGGAPVSSAGAAVTPESDEHLRVALGLGFHALAHMIPEKWGGGGLTEDERALLGDVWAGPLAPYLSGVGGVWAVAMVTTVQVFAVRALSRKAPEAAAPPVHKRDGDAPAAASEPVADNTDVPPPPARVTRQEPGVGDVSQEPELVR